MVAAQPLRRTLRMGLPLPLPPRLGQRSAWMATRSARRPMRTRLPLLSALLARRLWVDSRLPWIRLWWEL